jgi:dihydropyrimidine dehydrogenase (NAD+) subunit PreT
MKLMPISSSVPASPARRERRIGAPTQPLPRRPPGSAAPLPSESSRGRKALVLFVVALVGVCVVGMPYYTLSAGQRMRSPLHPWLKPSGYIGQSAGLLALAIFVFLWLYPVRKKFRWLAFTGTIGKWFNVHVLTALALPLLVAIHAAWRFEGLIGLGFWSMMVVWASGVAGRYVYARIPRGKAGVELTIEEIAAQRKALLAEITRRSGLEPKLVESTLAAAQPSVAPGGIWVTLRRMVADDLARRRAARALRRMWRTRGRARRKEDRRIVTTMLQLARREMALAQQARMLDATHAVFRYWHVLHRPVAVAALAAVLVHVAVVVALGATWLW